MADGAYREIRKALDEQTKLLVGHGEQLVRIEEQVKFTNGKVTKNCGDIDALFKLNNDRENFQERLMGGFNAYKYLGVLLGTLATVISIYSFFIKP